MSDAVEIPTDEGGIPAELWLPEGGTGPGMLLLQEIFGVSRYIQQRGADLAALGYVVLAPRLYWRIDELEPFLARGGVARVVEIHERDVHVLARGDVEHAGGRGGCGDVETLPLQQQLQRREDVRLVVRNEDPRLHQARSCRVVTRSATQPPDAP